MASASYFSWLPAIYSQATSVLASVMTSSVEEVVVNYQEHNPEILDDPEPEFQFTWQPLEHTERFIKDDGWTCRPIPTMLENVPEHLALNQLLKNVLVWSLQTRDETQVLESGTEHLDVHPEGMDDGDAPTEITQDTLDKPLQELSEADAPKDSTQDKVAASSETDSSRNDRSDASTISSTNSKQIRPLVSRLNQLRKDMTHKKSLRTKKNSRLKDDMDQPTIVELPINGECISCFDEYALAQLTSLECSHTYCKACLREVVLNAMKTESAFPPKCCLTEIPLKMALSCLDSNQRAEYKDKSAEYSIPAGHRWYCPEPKCAKWIRPEKLHRDRKSLQKCPHCRSKICSHCRSLAHEGEQDCPQDFGLNSTLEVAEAEGWRRCYSCRTMVELTTGCRHITCKCGAQFCYVCNAKWRTCKCTETDKERRLQQLRTQRADRERAEVEDTRRQAEEDAAALLEAEEVAEAIRQIEEMEREDAIRRVEDERQRQLEEELLLAQLEEARLLEEIAKREAEDAAERELRKILLISSREECQALMEALVQLLNHQHSKMMADHAVQEATCLQRKHGDHLQSQQEANTMSTWLHENIEQRKTRLRMKHKEALERLSRQFEEEEDDLFMQMTMYLRDKPNREQREKKMRDALQNQQTREHQSMITTYEHALAKLEYDTSYELEGLTRAAKTRLEIIEQQHQASLQELGLHVGSERRWFQLISKRRFEMLKMHRRLVLEQTEAGQEPDGLLMEQALQIGPFLPGAGEMVQDTVDGLIPVEHDSSVPLNLTDANEDADLYGGSSNRATPEAAPPSELAYVEPSVVRSDTIRNVPGAFPISSISQTSISQPNSRKHKFTDSAISMSGIMAMSFMVHSNIDAAESSRSSQKPHEESISTGGLVTGPDTDLLDTISASKISVQDKTDTGRKGLFKRFRKTRELSEEEIRRRMSSCVGDGV